MLKMVATNKKTVKNKTEKKAAKPDKNHTKAQKPKITKEMTLGEVAAKYPSAIMVLFKYGLHCIGCHVAAYETVEQGAMAHGLSDKEIKQMVEEMNKSI
jgi:hybrid cluster-associated redox disulfide protein